MSWRRKIECLGPPFQQQDEAAVWTNALVGANAVAPGMAIESFLAQGPWKLQIHSGGEAEQNPAEVQCSATSPRLDFFLLAIFGTAWS